MGGRKLSKVLRVQLLLNQQPPGSPLAEIRHHLLSRYLSFNLHYLWRISSLSTDLCYDDFTSDCQLNCSCKVQLERLAFALADVVNRLTFVSCL